MEHIATCGSDKVSMRIGLLTVELSISIAVGVGVNIRISIRELFLLDWCV